MTDDFQLFGEPRDAGSAPDPDIALITAYLARELSLVQLVAVEERLTTDPAFRDIVQPILDSWALPGTLVRKGSAVVARTPVLTPAQRDAAWQRHIQEDERGIRPAVLVATAGKETAIAPNRGSRRLRTVGRIAAILGLSVLPMLGAAQVVASLPRFAGTYAGKIARRLIGVVTRRGDDTGANPGAAGVQSGTSPDATTLEERQSARLVALAPTAQQSIVPHPLGPVVARSQPLFGSFPTLRVLPGGRVLVNDRQARRVVALDAALGAPRVILDSVAGRDNSYGSGNATLIPFRGDSTLVFSSVLDSFLVLTPDGRVARVLTGPASAFPPGVWTPSWSRLLGLVAEPFEVQRYQRLAAGAAEQTFLAEDTTRLVTLDPDRRDTGTVARLHNGTQLVHLTQMAPSITTPDLFPAPDQWVVTSDGTVAILRAEEYRVEWIGAGGTHTLGPRIPHDWVRITDDVRTHIIDSVNAQRRLRYEAQVAKWTQDSVDAMNGKLAVVGGGRGGAGTLVDADGNPVARNRYGAPRPLPPRFAEARDVPDYWPAIPSGHTMRADEDNDLWILLRPAGKPRGLDIYDVVNRAGRLIDRVEVPEGRSLAGFGPGGIVYLVGVDAGRGFIERTSRLR